ncbi:phage holin family protein [Pseudofrankia saprophytica]|uniref:phage holin family protein n=1 Tax=Pseudofrankia saprophytica TaxID=298655 RepID=UPI003158BF07
MPPDLEERPYSEDLGIGTDASERTGASERMGVSEGTDASEKIGRSASTGEFDPAGSSRRTRGRSPMDLSGHAATTRHRATDRTGFVDKPYPMDSDLAGDAHRGGTTYRAPFPDTYPEVSDVSARSVSQASAVTGASAGGPPAGEPIITPVGQMPESIRASARSSGVATVTPAATTTPATATAASPAMTRSTAAAPRVAVRTAAIPTEAEAAADGQITGGKRSRPSAGQLVSGVAADMSTLIRKEVELAKAEVRQSANRAGKGAGMFAGAGGAAVFAVLFLLLAAMFGLSEVMALGWAALIVAAILVLSAAVLGLVAKRTVKKVHPAPTQTVETLKEDVRWASGLRK